jgi:hypothetical protein
MKGSNGDTKISSMIAEFVVNRRGAVRYIGLYVTKFYTKRS